MMNRCLKEGELRAYVDSELAPPERARAERHLESCAPCRSNMAGVEAGAARVSALLDVLAADEFAPVQAAAWRAAARPAAMRRYWRTTALAAVAASIVVFYVMTRQQPLPVTKREPPTEPVQVVVSRPVPATVTPPIRTKPVRVRRPARPQPRLDDFMALGNTDPIQMGLVVRVMLPVSDPAMTGTQEIPADLLIGEDGRPRAIRFVP